MRRKEREVFDHDEIIHVINSCDTLRVGFYDGKEVYIVPLNFGYDCENGKFTFYFHSACEGRKVTLFQRGELAGFEMDCCHELKPANSFCDFTMMYKSIIGTGIPREVTGEEKMSGYRKLMAHYTDQQLTFQPEMVEKTKIFALDVKELRCKEHL